MSKKYKIPVLVLNLKNYQEIFAKNALKIALEAQKISQKYGKSFYSVSFNEGIALNSIEVFATTPIIPTCPPP